MAPFAGLRIDARQATPIYDQLVTQVKLAVAGGTVRPGDALPSVRRLAVELRVNPNTVARAWRELEAEGLVETRRGQGTFVADSARRAPKAQRTKAATEAVARTVAEARALGLSRDELDGLVEREWKRTEGGRS